MIGEILQSALLQYGMERDAELARSIAMRPHLRRVDGHWLCTASRTERHILRGTLGDTPCQAFYYFMQRENLRAAKEAFKFPVPYWC
jgi:hypothetical protein